MYGTDPYKGLYPNVQIAFGDGEQCMKDQPLEITSLTFQNGINLEQDSDLQALASGAE